MHLRHTTRRTWNESDLKASSLGPSFQETRANASFQRREATKSLTQPCCCFSYFSIPEARHHVQGNLGAYKGAWQQPGWHDPEIVAETTSRHKHKVENANLKWLGLFETSDPVPIDIPPSRRPLFLIIPKEFFQLGSKYCHNEHMGGHSHSNYHMHIWTTTNASMAQ